MTFVSGILILIHSTGELLDKIITRCSSILDHLIHFRLKLLWGKKNPKKKYASIWLFIIGTSKNYS